MSVVLLSLGSNIDAESNLAAAVRLLREEGRVLAVSPVYETEPVGTAGQPPFLNAALMIETSLGPVAFKRDVIGEIERMLGRVRDPRDRNAPRTIDVDIAIWEGGADGPVPDPDPSISRWAHLAIPLADIAPGRYLRGDGRTLATIAVDLLAAGPAPRPRPDVNLRPAAGLD